MKVIKFSSYSKQVSGTFNAEIGKDDMDYDKACAHVFSKLIDFSNFYKLHLEKDHGVEAREVPVHLENLKNTWYKANTKYTESSMLQYALDQIADFKPEVIYDHCRILLPVVSEIKTRFPFVKLLCTWDGWIPSVVQKITGYDIYFTCVPDLQIRHSNAGHTSYVNPFGFESSILQTIHIPEKKIEKISFIGSFSSRQTNFREQLLNALRKENYLDWYIGNIGRGFFTRSKLREIAYLNFSGLLANFPFEQKNGRKLYGKDMYEVMASYIATINIHGDNIEQLGNLRLIEASGVGTCQIIHWKPNFKDYFEPDTEAVYFKDLEELKSKSKYLVENPAEAVKIGLAGQKRTLQQHTFQNHVNRFWEAVLENLK